MVVSVVPSTEQRNYTVSQKKIQKIFDDNLNSKRPIVIIFGTVIT